MCWACRPHRDVCPLQLWLWAGRHHDSVSLLLLLSQVSDSHRSPIDHSPLNTTVHLQLFFVEELSNEHLCLSISQEDSLCNLSACCRRLGAAPGEPGARGTLPSSATDVGGGFPLRTAASPRVLGREASSRRDRPVASTSRALTSAGTPQSLA